MIRVSIVENDEFLLNTLGLVIGDEPDMDVVGLFNHGEDAIKSLPNLVPNIVLMDLDLGANRMNGIECIDQLRHSIPMVQIMVLTIYEDHDKVFKALSVGALGYLLKSSGKEKIIEAIREMNEGGSPITPVIARKIAESFNKQNTGDIVNPHADKLSDREKEVLALISKGKVEKEVAADLFISIKTVKAHIANIYAKLQVHSRVEALNKYYSR
ncbi:MAG: response regulator transcription factor [Saprospiraceae bacterium]|nr:response regulator transcription factor [Saprospiraceae bacterium]